MPTKKQINDSINQERYKEALERIDFLAGLIISPDLIGEYEKKFEDKMPGDLFLGAWFRSLNMVLEALWRDNEDFRDFMKPFVFNNFTHLLNSWHETTKNHNLEVSDASDDVSVPETSVPEVVGENEEEGRKTTLTLVEGVERPSSE